MACPAGSCQPSEALKIDPDVSGIGGLRPDRAGAEQTTRNDSERKLLIVTSNDFDAAPEDNLSHPARAEHQVARM